MDSFDFFLEAGFWIATIRMGTPLVFGTLGELICEKSGVLNLGIEGIMAAGCMSGWMWVYMGGDLWTGVLFAACIGAIFGLIHSLFTVYCGLSQHVTGLGITMLATALSSFVFKMLLPNVTTPPKITPFQPLDIPLLSGLSVVGQIFAQQSPLTLLALLMVVIVSYVLYRTPMGLALCMSGENPMAVESQGLSVFKIRTCAVMIGSALMAVGGAFLTLSAFDAFYIGGAAAIGIVTALSVLSDDALCFFNSRLDCNVTTGSLSKSLIGSVQKRGKIKRCIWLNDIFLRKTKSLYVSRVLASDFKIPKVSIDLISLLV